MTGRAPLRGLVLLAVALTFRPELSARPSTGLRVAPSVVEGQGRITNAKPETRSDGQGLEREVRTAAARGGVNWIGYRVPMVAGPRQMCCFDSIAERTDSSPSTALGATLSRVEGCCGMCRLESGSGVTMNTGSGVDSLARREGGTVVRVRTFTPDCDIDAAALPLIWFNDVKTDDSIAWLTSIVLAAPESGERHERAGKTA